MAAAVSKKSNERIKRPALPRTEPDRSWSTLFGATVPPRPAAAAPAANGASPLDPADAVRRGVDLGYGVIEEYLRVGQSFAQGFPGMAGGPSGPPGGPALPQLTERMFKYASDFASVWLEAMGTMVAQSAQSAGPSGPPAQSAGPSGPPASGFANLFALGMPGFAAPPAAPVPFGGQTEAAPAGARHAVELQVEARRSACATLDLHPGARVDSLLTGPLLAEAKAGPTPGRTRPATKAAAGAQLPGASISFDPVAGRIRVKVLVPARQQPGRYCGEVIDGQSRRPVGSLTVLVT